MAIADFAHLRSIRFSFNWAWTNGSRKSLNMLVLACVCPRRPSEGLFRESSLKSYRKEVNLPNVMELLDDKDADHKEDKEDDEEDDAGGR